MSRFNKAVGLQGRFLVALVMSGFCLETAAVEVGNLRARFREHLQWMDVKYGVLNEKATYFGAANMINIWFERPFDYSVGFAFGPAFGGAKSRGTVPIGTNRKVTLYNIGLEGKYFFLQHKPKWKGTFGRLGLFGNILDARGSVGVIGGAGYSLGIGYEFPYWKLGIAPEMSFSHIFLDGNSRILTFSLSLAVHFYLFSDDLLRMEI